MHTPDFPVDKIKDSELRRLAREGFPESVEILVALNVPDPQVAFVPFETPDLKRRGDFRLPGVRPKGFVPESAEQKEERARKTEEASQFLTELLGTTPHWLEAARAFVATATGRQLREIVSSPLVKFVEPNRRLTARQA